MSSDEPPFHTIAIVGLGLIGGSIALAIRERWPSIRIVGGRSRRRCWRMRAASGAIDRGRAHASPTSAPPTSSSSRRRSAERPAASRGCRRSLADGGLITDVGGTKRDIVSAAGALPARAARSSAATRSAAPSAAASPSRARPVPRAAVDSDARRDEPRAGCRATGCDSWQSLGARPTTMDADEHDRLMAYLSHLPQLTASALMEVVGGAAPSGLRLAGRGLVDTTRLASSPADVWREMCATNADDIGDALDQLIAALAAARAGSQMPRLSIVSSSAPRTGDPS